MKIKNNKFVAIVALMLAIVIGFGIATQSAVVTLPDENASMGENWSDYADEDSSGNSNSSKKGKYDYTYADGTTTKYFKELVTVDTNKKFAETLVVSGITNKQTGSTTKSNSYGTIDWTHANEGWFTLELTKSTSKKIKGAVDFTDADGNVTYYDWYMTKDTSYDIPVYMGDGKYTLTIFENTTGTKFAAKLVVTVNVKLNSPLAPYLHSTKEADFANSPDAVAKAKELTKNCKTNQEKINVIYNWVYDTIYYDINLTSDKTGTKQTEIYYDLDAILEAKRGVCGDRSALIAGMLRSLGIPCQHVMGKGHAWVRVWNETGTSTKDGIKYSTGTWVSINSTSKTTQGRFGVEKFGM